MDPFACNGGKMLLFFFRTYEVQGFKDCNLFFLEAGMFWDL